jgi:hypothetical protein
MLLNKKPPAYRGSMWIPQEKQKRNYLKFQVKQTAVLLVEVVVN